MRAFPSSDDDDDGDDDGDDGLKFHLKRWLRLRSPSPAHDVDLSLGLFLLHGVEEGEEEVGVGRGDDDSALLGGGRLLFRRRGHAIEDRSRRLPRTIDSSLSHRQKAAQPLIQAASRYTYHFLDRREGRGVSHVSHGQGRESRGHKSRRMRVGHVGLLPKGLRQGALLQRKRFCAPKNGRRGRRRRKIAQLLEG